MADIAVLGAGGPTGKECVEQALSAGKTVRAVVRNPDAYKSAFPEDIRRLQLVKGDVQDVDSLKSALEGVKGVVFAASGRGYWSAAAVDRQGVGNTAAVARDTGTHVVLVSSALVTQKNRFNPIRIILNNLRWNLLDEKLKGEDLLRQSGAAYTVVRPKQLTNGPGGQHLLLAEQGDKATSGKVSRADVATVCLAALSRPEAQGKTFELSSDANRPAPDVQLAQLFAGLKPDSEL